MITASHAFVREQLANGVSEETLRRRLCLNHGDITALLARRRGPDVIVTRIADRRRMVADALDLEEASAAVDRIASAVAGVYLIDPRLVFGSSGGLAVMARYTTFGLVAATRRHLGLEVIAKVTTFQGQATVQRGIARCTELRLVDRQFAGRYDRALARLGEP